EREPPCPGGAGRRESSRPACAPGCSTPAAGSDRQAGGRAASTGGGDWAGGARRVTSRAPVPAAEIGQPRQRWHSGRRRRLRELELGLSLARRGTPADSRRRPSGERGGRAGQNETRRLLATSRPAWGLPASCAGMDGPRSQQKPQCGSERVPGRGMVW
ncbi:hypothetical protein U0070_015916, partial [Myodes glareolus]